MDTGAERARIARTAQPEKASPNRSLRWVFHSRFHFISMLVPRANSGRMITMESTSTESQAERTAAPDRVRIVSTPGTCGGKPRIDGHRITVKHLVLDHQRGGMSLDEIVSAYPSLTLSDVYTALAYYHDHRADVDADIKADDEHWAEIERQNRGTLIDRLRHRKAEWRGQYASTWMRTALTRLPRD